MAQNGRSGRMRRRSGARRPLPRVGAGRGPVPTLAVAMMPHRAAHRPPAARTCTGCAARSPPPWSCSCVFSVLELAGLAGGGERRGGDDHHHVVDHDDHAPAAARLRRGRRRRGREPGHGWATILVDTERSLPRLVRARPTSTTSPRPASRSPTAWRSAGFVMDDLERAAGGGRGQRHAASASSPPTGATPQQADLFERRVDELGAVRGRQPGRPARPLGAPARHDDRHHRRGRHRRRPGVGGVARRPVGRQPRPRVRLHPQLPARRRARTCYDFEPWHLRYVGREHAAAVIDSGLTPARVPLGLRLRPRTPTSRDRRPTAVARPPVRSTGPAPSASGGPPCPMIAAAA